MERRKLVLLVDDNADDRELARAALQETPSPCRMVTVTDGIEAVDYLQALDPASLPELVLLDLNLPKLNGIEVLTHWRADPALRFVPVVVLSTSSEEADLEQAYKAGANGYVVKPLQFDRFVDTLAQVCRYWLTLNQPAVERT